MKIKQLLIPFRGDNCPTLLRKPKAFLVNACQGEQQDVAKVTYKKVKRSSKSLKEQTQDGPIRVEYSITPVTADFILFLSTVLGYRSYMSRTTGSRFINCVCDVLRSNETIEVNDFKIQVNREMQNIFHSDENFSFISQVPMYADT